MSSPNLLAPVWPPRSRLEQSRGRSSATMRSAAPWRDLWLASVPARRARGHRLNSSTYPWNAKSFRLGMPPSAADHNALGEQALASRDDLAENVLQRKLALFERQNAGVSDAAGLERSELGAIERRGGVDGACRDHIAQPHAKRQEFRQRCDLVVNRPIDAQRVDVRRDRVGHEAFSKHVACGLPAERAFPVSDVEDDAALSCGQHRRLDLALAVDRRVWKGAKAMG